MSATYLLVDPCLMPNFQKAKIPGSSWTFVWKSPKFARLSPSWGTLGPSQVALARWGFCLATFMQRATSWRKIAALCFQHRTRGSSIFYLARRLCLRHGHRQKMRDSFLRQCLVSPHWLATHRLEALSWGSAWQEHAGQHSQEKTSYHEGSSRGRPVSTT